MSCQAKLQKNVKWEWNNEYQAFSGFSKNNLSQDHILNYFEPRLDAEVTCNASPFYSHLRWRKQRTKINSLYSSFTEILLCVLQGSIFGHYYLTLTYMIIFYDINDLDFESFTDYDTPYYCLLDMISVLGHL